MPPNNAPPITLPQICAPREELLRVFDERAHKQYIYIHAPAGYGKTISTQLWLRKNGLPSSWIFLDRYDNMLSLFYRSLCRSLLAIYKSSWADGAADRQYPYGGELTKYLESPSFSAAPVESAIDFISMLSWKEGRYALVLDDLHNISNVELLKSLPYVFKRLPHFFNVLLLSRTSLPDTMPALTENDKVEYIDARELTFTPEEIRSHFINCGLFVSPKRAADIFSFTDGWVIILNAMLQSGNHELSYESQKPTLEDYFEKNIWGSFDDDTKSFLLKTSVVDSFTAELCELLTGSPDSPEILDMLIKGNINLSRKGREYRYHNLFLDFLRDRLPGRGIDMKALYSAAANYYLDSGEFYKAAINAMKQDDGRLKMQVVQQFFMSKNPALEQFLEISQVFDSNRISGEMYVRQPILHMPAILAAFLKGETGGMKTAFDRFYASLQAFIGASYPIAGAVPARLLLDYRRSIPETISFMDSVGIKLENKVPGQSAVITVQMPMPHRSVRDFHEFLDDGVKAAAYGLFSSMLPGDCDCFFHGVTAGLLMEQNLINEALEEALRAYGCLTDSTSYEVIFGISVVLAEIYSLKSEKDRSRSVLKRLRLWISDNKALCLLKNLEAYEKRLLMWDGSAEAASEWLGNYFVGDASFGEFYKIYQNFTTARAYIILSMADEATAALRRMKRLGEEMNRPLDAAEADVLLSVIEWSLGKREEACDRLHGILAGMQAYGFIRVIANEGKSVLPILAAVLKKMENRAVAGETESLYRFAKEVRFAAYEQSKRFRGLTSGLQLMPVKLSPKQSLVLELLSKGHTNKEIVEITGLSKNTIREHTRIAYRKLDVTNAMDAIVKYKRLGL